MGYSVTFTTWSAVIAVGWVLVAGGIAFMTYGVVSIGLGWPRPAGRRCRSLKNTRAGPLGGLLWGGGLSDYAWRAGILIAIGLLIVGKESGNFALTVAALCSALALLILQALLQRLRRRKLESLMRQRRSKRRDG
jgi:hypothetical protein